MRLEVVAMAVSAMEMRPESVIDYRGLAFLDAVLPEGIEPWAEPAGGRPVHGHYDALRPEIDEHLAGRIWVWPRRTVYFFSDLHADADAFLASLVASGGVAKTGPADGDLELTAEGRNATFVLGGDYLDKGPSNLRLLRAIRHLRDAGADLILLAGNHDLRTLLGLAYMGDDRARFAHLFVRMGKKSIPLFEEVRRDYLQDAPAPTRSLDEVERLLFPDESWYREFPSAVGSLMSDRKLAKELRRIREKTEDLHDRCAAVGMTLPELHQAAEKCRELFLEPDGEFHWLFDRMRLTWRAGSVLFAHAGLDDEMAAVLRRDGVEGLNARFAALLEDDLFELYNGAVGNMFRTKYRPLDYPLTPQGLEDVRAAGIHAIAHGHRNVLRGQRLTLRAGLLHFECDASLDINTRAVEGLSGRGGAATIFREDGSVLGISTDHPLVKQFDPAEHCDSVTIVGG